MLPAVNRLKTDRDISRVVKSGRSVYAKLIGLKFVPNQKTASRFGFSVGTKISKKATVRNLLKRRMREIVRLRVTSLASGFDALVVAKPGLQNLGYCELESELTGLFRRSGLLKGSRTIVLK